MCAYLGVTCSLHFWQNDRGLFTCHCGNTGVEWTPNKSQHTKLTLEKKIFPPLLPGFELATFRSRVRRSNQQAIPAPLGKMYSRKRTYERGRLMSSQLKLIRHRHCRHRPRRRHSLPAEKSTDRPSLAQRRLALLPSRIPMRRQLTPIPRGEFPAGTRKYITCLSIGVYNPSYASAYLVSAFVSSSVARSVLV